MENSQIFKSPAECGLDTNACIIFLNRPMSAVRQRLESLSPADIVVCSIVKAELFYGAMRSNNPARTLALELICKQKLKKPCALPSDESTSHKSLLHLTLYTTHNPYSNAEID
ncbi:PIN domain-containing protein [Nostoc sp. DSM 114167]|jgi:predicted nucleic acid-binding protein|uniref:PIN domain-containing protein n=1 Tax=Nostoc sp. DSM 114167 TaxID=3439050 RepID=UPI004045C01F